MNKTIYIIFLVLVVAACDVIKTNKWHTHSGISTRGSHRLSDSTFCYYSTFFDGCSDTSYYKCEPSEIREAAQKILYSHIYSSLNWKAQEEYHERLVIIKTEKFRPNVRVLYE